MAGNAKEPVLLGLIPPSKILSPPHSMDTFDPATRRELDAFLAREQAAAKLNATVHNMTTMCWDKCITSTPSNKFSGSEAACLTSCVDRFMDTSMFLIKSIRDKQQSH